MFHTKCTLANKTTNKIIFYNYYLGVLLSTKQPPTSKIHLSSEAVDTTPA
jgi:hypothetical protein